MRTTPTDGDAALSRHAADRMNQRRLSGAWVELVQQYGREVFARGAVFCFVGRKEVAEYAARADLTGVEGVHVLVARDGTVITVYRNRGFHPSRYRKPNYRTARLTKARRRGLRRWL